MKNLDSLIETLTDAQEAISLLDKLLSKWDWQKQEIVFEPLNPKDKGYEYYLKERREIYNMVERYMEKNCEN